VIRLLTDPGEIVLDCFMGSGTTAVAAIEENRLYIGIELEEKYIELSRKKIESGTQIKLISEASTDPYAHQPTRTQPES
jgi:site-specific DNA-methyltransferase (adenine-specific)